MKAVIEIHDESDNAKVAEKIMGSLGEHGFGGMFNLDVTKEKVISFLIPGHYDEFAWEIEQIIEEVIECYDDGSCCGITATYEVKSMSVFDERIKSNVNHVVRGINLLDSDIRRRAAIGENVKGDSYESRFADGYLIKDINMTDKYICITITILTRKGRYGGKGMHFYITNNSNKVYNEKEWDDCIKSKGDG